MPASLARKAARAAANAAKDSGGEAQSPVIAATPVADKPVNVPANPPAAPSTAGGSSKKAPKAAAPPSPAATAAAPATASTPTKHNHGYSRDPSDTATVGDEQRVHKLLSDRLAAKRAREFDQADRIREELLSIGIQVFDRVKFWRVAPPEGAKAAASPAPKGGGSGGPGPAAKSASRPQSGGSATKALSGQIAPADAALAAAEAAGLTLQRAPGSATGFVGVKYAAGEVNPYKAFYESKGEGARIYHLGYYACAEAAALAHAFKTKEMEGGGGRLGRRHTEAAVVRVFRRRISRDEGSQGVQRGTSRCGGAAATSRRNGRHLRRIGVIFDVSFVRLF